MIRYTVLVAVLTLPALLAGCPQKQDEKLLGACWNPGAKETVQSLAKRIVSRHIVAAINSSDNHKRPQGGIDAYVERSLTVNVSNFYVTAADATSGSVTCGADAAMVFKRPDGKTLSADDASFSFAVYRSENDRSMYVIPSSLALSQMVDDSAVSDDASAPASAPALKAPTSPPVDVPGSDVAPAVDAASAASAANAVSQSQ
ncbi:hypothetical protein EOS_41590 [Caballeronia mineralivorans PML1(12)]|uniref:Lipoprotein n=1 Tax=Caballeronia mineralivorans PML1(12) TaxID=908627 RepID=A0A0J1FKU2_9BURK|nr:hypothetical protein [Caballeronia mineralivorans]KLU20358.1 hypothetical protein EOS_41590 [Caballeronia mineralivorans PML1(12)]